MKNIKSILLVCLCVSAGYRGFAQDVAQSLTGGGSRTWELREIHWFNNQELESEEFSEDAQYARQTELAQLVPETIVFHDDGTCDLLYVSYYTENDELVVRPLELKGQWSFDGQSVKILEPTDDGVIDEEKGSAWWLEDIVMGEGKFESKFNLYGFTDGIRGIEYEVQQ
ncbi:MAG: hypothetical protein HY842_10975 [Bacteroidetes bacterium]|nr:hypothetical protein [Bacteroidota bacterium]